MAEAAQIATTTELDVAFCRGHFPALGGDWVFLENAGGTLVPDQVIARLNQFTSECQVQPGAGYPASDQGAARIAEGQAALAALINADPGEIVIGPSTSSNVYVLSHALRPLLAPGPPRNHGGMPPRHSPLPSCPPLPRPALIP